MIFAKMIFAKMVFAKRSSQNDHLQPEAQASGRDIWFDLPPPGPRTARNPCGFLPELFEYGLG
jgi:hypothetical protein